MNDPTSVHPSGLPKLSINPERLERLVFLVPDGYLDQILRLAQNRPSSDERDRTLARLARRFAALGRPSEVMAALDSITEPAWKASALEQALPDLDGHVLLSVMAGLEGQPIWQEATFQELYPRLLAHLAHVATLEQAINSVFGYIRAGVFSWETLVDNLRYIVEPYHLIPVIKELLPQMPTELQAEAESILGLALPPESEANDASAQAPWWFADEFDTRMDLSAKIAAMSATLSATSSLDKLDADLLRSLGEVIASDYGYFVGYLVEYLAELRLEHRQAVFNTLVLSSSPDRIQAPAILACATPELIRGSSQKVRTSLRKMLRWTATNPDLLGDYWAQPIKKFTRHTLRLDRRASPVLLAASLAQRLFSPCDALGWLGSLLGELDEPEA